MKKMINIVLAVVAQFFVVGIAMAQEAAHAATTGGGEGRGLVALSAALAMGLGALGGTLSQGKAVAAALEGVARNPGAADKVQNPMILGLALIESLVLMAFVIAYMLQGKV